MRQSLAVSQACSALFKIEVMSIRLREEDQAQWSKQMPSSQGWLPRQAESYSILSESHERDETARRSNTDKIGCKTKHWRALCREAKRPLGVWVTLPT